MPEFQKIGEDIWERDTSPYKNQVHKGGITKEEVNQLLGPYKGVKIVDGMDKSRT